MSRTWIRRLAVGSVTVVALVAAVVSYAHMYELAERSGEAWRAWLFPLSVDGMLLAATLAIVDRRRAGLPAGWVPWAGLVLGIGASLVANVAAAEPTLTAQAVAAWPPLALAISVETLVIVLRNTAATHVPTDQPDDQHNVEQERPEHFVDLSEDTAAEDDETVEPAPDWWASAEPVPARPTVSQPPRAESEVDDKHAARLIAEGAGRRRLAKELDITEHAARELLAEHRGADATAGATR